MKFRILTTGVCDPNNPRRHYKIGDTVNVDVAGLTKYWRRHLKDGAVELAVDEVQAPPALNPSE